MKKDILNLTFGNITVIEFIGNLPIGTQGKRRGKWKCLCSCGKECDAFTGDLTSGNKRSCGCLGKRKGNTKQCSRCKIFLDIDSFTKTASQCRNCSKIRRKELYNPVKASEKYYRNLTEEQKLKRRNYAKRKRDLNPEKYNEETRQWRLKNPNYKKNKWKKDINFRIMENMRGRIYKALKTNSKSKKTAYLLGCTVEQLKQHLENLFSEGMSWENYGEWHVDHKKPCSLFDFTLESEQKECFNFNNLQPLWAKDNLSKSNKYG